jgi:potassium-dependent mechanosensitive channel
MADAAQRAAEISMEQYMDGLVDFNTSVSTLRMLASQQDQRASIQGPATANLYFCSQRHTKQQVEIPMLAQLYGRVFFIAFLLTLFFSCLPSTGRGEQQPSSAPAPVNSAASSSDVLNLDQLKVKRTSIEAMEGLEDSIKKAALSFLDQAILSETIAVQSEQGTKALHDKVTSAPDRIRKLRKEMKAALPSPDLSILSHGTDLALTEQKIFEEELNLAAAKAALDTWEAELEAEQNSPQQIRQETDKTNQQLLEVGGELKKAPPHEEHLLVTDARRVLLLAEKRRWEALLKLQQDRWTYHEQLLALLTAERNSAVREVAYREAVVKSWQAQIMKLRQEQAAQARKGAEAEKKDAPTTLEPIQKELDINVKFSQDLERISERQASLTAELESQKKLLAELEEEFALSRKRVESSVLTDTLSFALRKQRQVLPRQNQYRWNSAKRRQELAQVIEAQMDVENQLKALTHLDEETDQILRSLDPLSARDADSAKIKIETLLSSRHELLEKLELSYRRYSKDLQDIEYTEQTLLARAGEYADFLDAHLLWIRSFRFISWTDIANLPEAVIWAINPLHWFRLLGELGLGVLRNPTSWVVGLLLIALFFAGRPRAKSELSKVALSAREAENTTVGLPLKALGLTLYLALAFPFLMSFVGYQLFFVPDNDDFSRAVGGGLFLAARTLAVVAFLYHFCRHLGLAEAHFSWPEDARQSLRHNLLWVIQWLIPLSFIVGMTAVEGNALHYNVMGRFGFIALLIMHALFFARLLRPSGAIGFFIRAHPLQSWVFRLRRLWYLVLVGTPVFVAGLAAVGYQYTASVLHVRYNATLLIILFFSLAHGLIMKWISNAGRSLALPADPGTGEIKEDQAAAPQEQTLEEQQRSGELLADETRIKELDQRSRTLLNIVIFVLGFLFLWAIWAPVLPALKLAGGTSLWTYMTEVDGVKQSVPITLVHLVTALVTVGLTVAAARNLPGVLELLLLNRLPLDTGARYAINALLRYAITAIGIIVIFNALGLRWSSIQWLVAALSVGLGFGLQEIVANFICGLIILFERPFRVGDVVTIGDQSGRVTRIQIRATTITDWDRRELIVPNKEFITGKLINWSLSDPISRLVIPVGVAYGSDTQQVEKLLLKIARENLMVLSQPEPSALFLGFGDNALNFELRVFVTGMSHRIPVTHSLHMTIEREFRKAGINIAFPQRDVHLDALGPLEVHLVRDPTKNREGQGKKDEDLK